MNNFVITRIFVIKTETETKACVSRSTRIYSYSVSKRVTL